MCYQRNHSVGDVIQPNNRTCPINRTRKPLTGDPVKIPVVQSNVLLAARICNPTDSNRPGGPKIGSELEVLIARSRVLIIIILFIPTVTLI